MLYKVEGDTGNARTTCGHRVHKGVPYYIVRSPFTGDLKSKCEACTTRKEHFTLIRIPQDLVE